MDKTLFDSAINAIRALIIAELDTDSPARFTRAMKLCQQAHVLVQMNVKRVGMIVPEDDGFNPYVIGTPGALVARNGQADSIDLVRELISAMTEINKPKADAVRLEHLAKIRELAVIAGRSTVEIDKQIDAEIALTIAAKETPHVLASLPVADPLLLRGHSLGDDRQETLQDDRLEGNGEGAGGDLEVVRVCREEVVADEHTLGYVAED